jgi:hypothetical protein
MNRCVGAIGSIFVPLEIAWQQTKFLAAERPRGLGTDAGRCRRRSYPCCSIEDVAMKSSHHSVLPTDEPFDLDLDELLHPAQAFEHPQQVVDDPDLTVNEMRAILACWASDACAVEAAPALRRPPGASRAVCVDEVLEALRTLDRQANADAARASWARRQVRRGSFEGFPARRAREHQDPGPAPSG